MVQPKYTYELNHKIPESENSGRINQVSPGLIIEFTGDSLHLSHGFMVIYRLLEACWFFFSVPREQAALSEWFSDAHPSN